MPEATLTPSEFVRLWQHTELTERASAQAHFIDVCRMIGHELPHEQDPTGENFAFEYGVKKNATGKQGFADVFYRGHFAIEYKQKGKYKDLSEAYQQLLLYRENLMNPPLLVVCDIETWEIHTNFPNTEKKIRRFTNSDLTQVHVQKILHNLFYNPEALHPDRNTEEVTAKAATVFQSVADNMRGWQADPERIAHFLTKLVFCLFAEDVNLLPNFPRSGKGIFSELLELTSSNPAQFKKYITELFQAMADGGEILAQKIPYFNGKLFEDTVVEDVESDVLIDLAKAANLNWSAIEPAIFGTLFERSLDPSKRAQLGAHYTSRDDILLIVEPVLMQPLRREWDAIKAQAAVLRAEYDTATKPSLKITRQKELEALREQMLKRLREIKVLDPACGSGNFLYVSLNLLLDMEKAVINDPLFFGFSQRFPEVHPRQLYGMELDPIAHALASIVVWIGYIQWRQNNGYLTFKEPILEALNDNIRCMDAILAYDADGKPVEPEWATVDVIVGNPPFLGDKKMRGELGDSYVDALRKLYTGRVPGGADFVTYWFEKARAHIASGKAKRAGLLSTNSIRGGANREILKQIKDTGDIFLAWSDREWILDGAAVRVSMVGFDNAQESTYFLDGNPVSNINSDLTAQVDITAAKSLISNHEIAFIGTQKGGPFDINEKLAKQMVDAKNLSGKENSDVIFRWVNGSDIVGHMRNMWIIDFGAYMSLDEARLYELPFKYVEKNVLPKRVDLKRTNHRDKWWIHAEARPGMRKSLETLSKYIITPRVSKHRVFAWVDIKTIPDSATVAIARDDDYFFGVLHSKLHEVWSLRMGTWLGKGNDPRYTPTTTFETFPFPWSPGKEPVASSATGLPSPSVGEGQGVGTTTAGEGLLYDAIAAAAKQLHEERHAWLNPPNPGLGTLKDRTLTNLYNALNVYRGVEKMKIKTDAGNFAPRLDELHQALDRAVCAAYGWEPDILNDEEAILSRLLALNLQRASS